MDQSPGLRIYSNFQIIPRILGGLGGVILSTSRGIMTDREAQLERIAGEIGEGLIIESLPNDMFQVMFQERSDIVLYGYFQEIKSKLKPYNLSTPKQRFERLDDKIWKKTILKNGLHGRIGLHKSTRKVPKEVIHIQANVRGRVVSWSSAGTCGFRGTRRGMSFAAQTAVGNANAIVDQGMKGAKIMIKGPGLIRDAALLAISRSAILLIFVRDVTPMTHNGQANTIGITMRRDLLGEIEGTCITHAKSEKISHEYPTIMGIQESIHENLMNLKKSY
ncbi:DNA-directed RNA polymerase, insert domain-containing protein [Cynara cardunculus var. scolymus]|uniref:Small ribosomal subunit protein uS8c n=1 Tax=Cynara cardunculus var. scolymus TaxID=59895 RepID=A0A103YL85_CYNCS|nr:DNA-directed RNA polymerase, insert domain-containing protein [Cynara cardunculus var. scolymus]